MEKVKDNQNWITCPVNVANNKFKTSQTLLRVKIVVPHGLSMKVERRKFGFWKEITTKL